MNSSRQRDSIFSHPVLREWLAISLALIILAVAAILGNWLARIDQSVYDQAMRVWVRPANPDIVIIGIDEESLKQIGRWPWSRATHATLLNQLAKAKPKAVAVDIILVEPDRRDPLADKTLADAIRNAGNIIVPVVAQVGDGVMVDEAKPIPQIAEAVARFAHIATLADADGVLRSVMLRAGVGAPHFNLLGAEAYLMASNRQMRDVTDALKIRHRPEQRTTWQFDNPFVVPYVGSEGSFKTVSYIDVLRGDVPAETFRGKTVFIGMTASGLDELPTPVSGNTRAMPGVEIHANVMQALGDGIVLRVLERSTNAILTSMLVLILMFAFLWLSPRRAISFAMCTIAVIAIGVVLLFRYGMVWIPPSVAILCVLLAYPLWSWRKLEATQRYFDAELQRLSDEPMIVPAATAQAIAPIGGLRALLPDVIERRIEAMTVASGRMRSLKRFVDEIIESLPTAALVTDVAGNIMLSNSAADRLFATRSGKPADVTEALEGRHIMDIISTLQLQESGDWVQVISAARTSPTNVTVEARRNIRAGEDMEENFAVQFAPLDWQQDSPIGAIITIADITPLRESERRRDEALRFLSHDMRSPQASIITLLEMVREDPQSITQSTLLERIGKYARRTLNLADDFLRLAKAERAKLADFNAIELGEILADVLDEAEALAHVKSIRVVISNVIDEAWTRGDRDLVTRAIVNLVSNAVKYSPEKTTVTLALTKVEQFWRIDVIDQGYGISPENLARLFTRFQRFSEEGQPPTDGIGLGLVFVKTVLERMNGHVSVTSKVAANLDANVTANVTDKHGTTFSISFPHIEPD